MPSLVRRISKLTLLREVLGDTLVIHELLCDEAHRSEHSQAAVLKFFGLHLGWMWLVEMARLACY